jgi:hypothetical protein
MGSLSSLEVIMVNVFVLGLMHSQDRSRLLRSLMGGCGRGGRAEGGNVHLGAFKALRGLLPFLLVTGALGIALVYFGPRAALLSGRLWERDLARS